jgi:hypothetical protein
MVIKQGGKRREGFEGSKAGWEVIKVAWSWASHSVMRQIEELVNHRRL